MKSLITGIAFAAMLVGCSTGDSGNKDLRTLGHCSASDCPPEIECKSVGYSNPALLNQMRLSLEFANGSLEENPSDPTFYEITLENSAGETVWFRSSSNGANSLSSEGRLIDAAGNSTLLPEDAVTIMVDKGSNGEPDFLRFNIDLDKATDELGPGFDRTKFFITDITMGQRPGGGDWVNYKKPDLMIGHSDEA